MPELKRLICLANSRKLSGRCVAGKELTATGSGAWIRPVSDRPSEEVSERERQYEDGSDPQVLDLVRVPVLSHKPKSYQPENWLLDPHYYWEREGRAVWRDLAAMVDDPAVLWQNTSSSGKGINDRVALEEANGVGASLYLLHLAHARIRVYVPGAAFGETKRRVQASFVHRGTQYSLWVTDPVIEKKYLSGPDGLFSLGECYAAISLGEPFDGFCYKLVAAIITPDRAGP
jgi:hypothetical protein